MGSFAAAAARALTTAQSRWLEMHTGDDLELPVNVVA